jgi:hypothetical protein
MNSYCVRDSFLVSGMTVTCIFKNGDKIDGIIHVGNNGKMWICHDAPMRSGDNSPVLWGKSRSWVFRYVPEKDRFTEDVVSVIPTGNIDFKVGVNISERLQNFLDLYVTRQDVLPFFYAKVKPFEHFLEYDLAETQGMITLGGTVKTANGEFKKKVEVKLSRFIRTTSDKLAESPLYSHLRVEDKTVEKTQNSLVSYQSGGLLRLEYLSGDRILEGYTSANYSTSGRSTLHNSCMSDKLSYLSIYTSNPQVRLAVLRSPMGIEARCLVWETESGSYRDRIYYSQDWIERAMSDRMKSEGHGNLPGKSYSDDMPYVRVRLDSHEHDAYPYLDNLLFLSGDGHLYAAEDQRSLPPGKYRVLRSTNGQVSHLRVE